MLGCHALHAVAVCHTTGNILCRHFMQVGMAWCPAHHPNSHVQSRRATLDHRWQVSFICSQPHLAPHRPMQLLHQARAGRQPLTPALLAMKGVSKMSMLHLHRPKLKQCCCRLFDSLHIPAAEPFAAASSWCAPSATAAPARIEPSRHQ